MDLAHGQEKNRRGNDHLGDRVFKAGIGKTALKKPGYVRDQLVYNLKNNHPGGKRCKYQRHQTKHVEKSKLSAMI